MRILVVGDFHGRIPKKLEKRLLKEKGNIDLVLGVGDYAGVRDWRKYILYMFRETAKGKSRDEIKSPEEFFGDKGFKELIKKEDGIYHKLHSMQMF